MSTPAPRSTEQRPVLLTPITTSKTTVLGIRIDHERRAWVEAEAAREGLSVRALFERMIDQARAGTTPVGPPGERASDGADAPRAGSGPRAGASRCFPGALCSLAAGCARSGWRVGFAAISWMRRVVDAPAGPATDARSD